MAGELVASVVVKELVRKLGSRLWPELGLLWHFKKDLQGMKTTLESIQVVLNDAEKRSFKDGSVCLWLKRLKAAAYDIEDMLDEFQVQNPSKVLMFTSSRSTFSVPIMARRLKNMRKRLDAIAAERNKYNLREEAITYDQKEVIDGRKTFSAVNRDDVLGRDEEAAEIINRLLFESNEAAVIPIVPIVGIGGLGKTTIAKLIFNDDRMEVFEPRIWVHAMDFEVEKLVDAMLLSLRIENSNIPSNLECNVKIIKQILDGKRYLIVLDDVWNEDWQKWDDFKQILQGGKRGSRIIVTTRSGRVPLIMHAETPHLLKCLSDDVCSKLFEQRAFKSTGAKDNLIQIRKEIVSKCQGIPLTAKALGGMLCFQSGELAWKKVRDSEFWELKEEESGHPSENKIISSLKLSYQYMPSHLKLCFVYCSLYPKSFELEKDLLIQQWIAQGFIQTEHETEALQIGDSYVNYLLSMSFFEETGMETYKMHDLVYDLARSVAGEEVSVLDARKGPNINAEECRYATIIRYDHPPELQKVLLQKVRALNFKGYFSLHKKIFSWTKYLRVLDLSKCDIYELPTSTYKLKHLRYLILPNNLRRVDERIGNLWSLATLKILGNRSITTLPVSIGKLRNLIYLNISGCCRLVQLPDSIGDLQKLRSLTLHACFDLETLPDSLGNLVNLEKLNMTMCNHIRTLPASIGKLRNLLCLDLTHCDGLLELPESIGCLQKLRSLKLTSSDKLQNLSESLSHLVNLEMLSMKGYKEIHTLSASIGKLHNLIYFDLSDCPELSELPQSIGSLQTLNYLKLDRCSNLLSLPETLSNLVNLKTLDARGCTLLNQIPSTCNITHLNIEREEPLQPPRDLLINLLHGPPREGKFTENCRAIMRNINDAKRTNLKERWSIQSLTYECDYNYHDSYTNRGIVDAMLEELIPHPNLAELFIWGFHGLMFPGWMRNRMESFLPNLIKIKLEEIPHCELPVLGQLPKLEEIHLWYMPNVRRISGESYAARNTGTSFPSLKKLVLRRMSGLEEWVTEVSGEGERGASLFPCLESLSMYDCPRLQVQPCIPPSVKTLELGKSMLPLLTVLNIHEMSLKCLRIKELEDLTHLPESVQPLTSLETLEIKFCESIATLPEWLGELSSLRSLEIHHCSLVDRLPQSIQCLSSLKSLDITGCSGSLLKRTEKETGEDWDKISHIEYVRISKDRYLVY